MHRHHMLLYSSIYSLVQGDLFNRFLDMGVQKVIEQITLDK